MSWKEEVALTLQSLIESVQDEKTGLGENVDKLEEGENSRRQERSLLLSKTFKKIFAALNEKDKKMVATIKTNAYDVTRQLDKVEREIKKLLVDVEKSDDGREAAMKAFSVKLKSKVANVDVNAVNSMCNVSVGQECKELENVLQKAIASHLTTNTPFNGSMCLGDLEDDDIDIRQPIPSAMPLTAIPNHGFAPSPHSAMPISVTQEAPPGTPPIHNSSKATGRGAGAARGEATGRGAGAARGVTNLSDVREATGEADVTIFSPVSDRGMVSTMRPTAMKGKLDGALIEFQKNLEAGVASGERGDTSSLVSAMNGMSVEDMQKSLSSAECSIEDDDLGQLVLEDPDVQEIAVLNRSVSFAAKTRIIQDLETPQPGQVQARFRIDHGNTKVKDGQAGVVKRLMPKLNDVNEENDPHVDLNASKAPSPTLADQSLQCDPAWNTESGAVHEWAPSPLEGDQSFATKVGMSDQSRINMSNWEQDLTEPDEPLQCDPAWNTEREVDNKRVPSTLKVDQSFASKVGMSNQSRMDMSVWEQDVQPPKDLSGFNLALGLVEQVEIYLPGDLGEDKGCMQSPVHIEYANNFSKFLISEPEYNRIGVYSNGTVAFQGWFGGRTDPFDYPTSILYLDTGFIAVLERSMINIYDKDAKLIQKIVGCYNGLAVAHEGDFVTTQKTQDMKTHIAVIGQVNGEGDFIIKEKVTITVIANKMKSKVRFLAVHDTKIYASDYGMNAIYVVDMRSRSQSSIHSLGLECKEPCAMLVDDLGNMLVADSGNNRLVVFNVDGEFVRQFGSPVKGVSTPSDLVKVRGRGKDGGEEDHILVTYSGSDGTDGRLVRYKCI